MTVTDPDYRSFPRNILNLELNIMTLSPCLNSLCSTCLSCHFLFTPYRSWHSRKSHSVIPQVHLTEEIYLHLLHLDQS